MPGACPLHAWNFPCYHVIARVGGRLGGRAAGWSSGQPPVPSRIRHGPAPLDPPLLGLPVCNKIYIIPVF